MNHPVLFVRHFVIGRLLCWAFHRRHHEYRPVHHSYWRFCEKCQLAVLVED